MTKPILVYRYEMDKIDVFYNNTVEGLNDRGFAAAFLLLSLITARTITI